MNELIDWASILWLAFSAFKLGLVFQSRRIDKRQVAIFNHMLGFSFFLGATGSLLSKDPTVLVVGILSAILWYIMVRVMTKRGNDRIKAWRS